MVVVIWVVCESSNWEANVCEPLEAQSKGEKQTPFQIPKTFSLKQNKVWRQGGTASIIMIQNYFQKHMRAGLNKTTCYYGKIDVVVKTSEFLTCEKSIESLQKINKIKQYCDRSQIEINHQSEFECNWFLWRYS